MTSQTLIVSFIFLPLLYWKSQDYSQSIAFMTFPILFTGAIISNKWLGRFLIWTAIGTALCSFNIVQWESTCFVFSGVIIFYILKNYIEPEKIYKWIWILVLINCIYLVFQYCNIDPIWEYHDCSPDKNIVKDRLVGIMSWQNHLGMIGAIVLPLALAKNRFMILPCILLVCISQSIICMIASILSVIGYYFDYFVGFIEDGMGYIPLIFIVILLATIPIGYKYNLHEIVKEKLKTRGSIYYDTLRYGLKKPIQGHGIGSWKTTKFRERQTTVQTHKLFYDKLNCQYLQIFFEQGLIGLILIGGLIYNFFCSYRAKTKHIFYALFSLLIIGIFQSPMNYPRISGLSILLYSMYKQED